MTTERLDLQLEEPGDDPLSDQVLDILRDALRPDPEVSLEVAVNNITALLPARRPYSTEVRSFIMTCYEIAEQSPYYHASMVRLVTIIDLCLNSSRLLMVDVRGHDEKGLLGSDVLTALQDAPTGPTGPEWRYQMLSETIRDSWDSKIGTTQLYDRTADSYIASHPDDCPAKYVNFHTFIARIYERGLIQGCNLPIWAVQDAFQSERREAKTEEGHNACVKAALQYLLLRGDAIHLEITEDQSKQHKWQRWYEQVMAVAAEKTEEKRWAYSEDTVDLAGRAMVAMEAIARLKARVKKDSCL